MNKQEAIQIVISMASSIKATIQEHDMIKQAITYLNTLEEMEKEVKVEIKKDNESK